MKCFAVAFLAVVALAQVNGSWIPNNQGETEPESMKQWREKQWGSGISSSQGKDFSAAVEELKNSYGNNDFANGMREKIRGDELQGYPGWGAKMSQARDKMEPKIVREKLQPFLEDYFSSQPDFSTIQKQLADRFNSFQGLAAAEHVQKLIGNNDIANGLREKIRGDELQGYAGWGANKMSQARDKMEPKIVREELEPALQKFFSQPDISAIQKPWADRFNSFQGPKDFLAAAEQFQNWYGNNNGLQGAVEQLKNSRTRAM